MRDIKLVYQFGDKKKSIDIGKEKVLLGKTEDCQIKVTSNSGPDVKAFFIREQNNLFFGLFDPNLKIKIYDQSATQVTLKNNSTFFLGPIKFSVEFGEEETIVPIDFDQKIFPDEVDSNIGIISEQSPTEDINEFEKHIQETATFKPESFDQEVLDTPSSYISLDYTKEDITFDDSHYQPLFKLPFDEDFDYSDYNDPFQDNLKSTGTSIIKNEGKSLSIQLSHLNNGVCLDSRYFDIKSRRIYLSSNKSTQKIFKVYDFDFKKHEFIYTKDEDIFVTCPDGYVMDVCINEKIVKIEDQTIKLPEDGRVIISKGTSQIILEIKKSPPTLNSPQLWEVDEKLVKIQGAAWSLAVLIALMIWIIGDIPEQQKPKKKIAVIYKRKLVKPTVNEKNNQETKQSSSASSEVTQQKEKSQSKQQKKKVQKKNIKVAKKSPSQTKKLAKSIKKSPSKNVAIKTPPKKAYSFNISSQVKRSISSSENSLASVSSEKSVTTGVAQGTKASKSISSANIASDSLGSSGYKNSEIGTASSSGGARGLSGKGTVFTAYDESETRVLGAIDPELIRKLLREKIPQFRYCYQKELLVNSDINGVFDLLFQITPTGKGVNVDLKNKGSKFSQRTKDCIAKVVSLIQFPKPKGGGIVDVKQPLNFQSER